MRTIKVTGNGEMKIHPDTTRITITLEGGSPEYGETLRRSSKDTEAIKELLMPFGFAKRKASGNSALRATATTTC